MLLRIDAQSTPRASAVCSLPASPGEPYGQRSGAWVRPARSCLSFSSCSLIVRCGSCFTISVLILSFDADRSVRISVLVGFPCAAPVPIQSQHAHRSPAAAHSQSRRVPLSVRPAMRPVRFLSCQTDKLSSCRNHPFRSSGAAVSGIMPRSRPDLAGFPRAHGQTRSRPMAEGIL